VYKLVSKLISWDRPIVAYWYAFGHNKILHTK
jgi:hypothetical protein